MHPVKSLAILVCAVLLLTACARRSPMEDIVNAPTGAPPGTELATVTDAIMKAGEARSWQMTETRPGLIHGKLVTGSGKHEVAVDVSYDTKNFSITYVDSKNMNYEVNFDGPYIHYKYNRWVRILKEDIQDALARAS